MGTCCTKCCGKQRKSSEALKPPPSILASKNSRKDSSTQIALSSGKHDKASSRRTTQHGVMTQIAMKFPKIRKSFHLIKEVFHKHAGNQNWVPKSSVKLILIELGANEEELTDEEIDLIIRTCNLDGDDKIEFKEFLIACSVGLFLKKKVEKINPHNFRKFVMDF